MFGLVGENFLTKDNASELVRLGVELGLLALALTPVIITGGIDLSVGSLLGLCAVTFGFLWRDAGFCPLAAAFAVLLLGLIGGGLNGWLITRFSVSPLIVTLATLSLYRGLAEGLTAGVDNFSNFPAEFLFLGQGFVGGALPVQSFVLFAAAAGYYLLLHRTIVGRALYAIGFSAEGARYAGLPVTRRLRLVYLLSGLAAGLASVIYVAHLGQAKSDAGTSYELMAITAVVLGGTSIYGGRGTVAGTLLGLIAIVVLQNGLRLADLPAELGGILTGVLLVAAISAERLWQQPATSPIQEEGDEMKNWQLAVLSAVILASGLIVAASNWYLVRSLGKGQSSSQASLVAGNASPAHRPLVAMMPKAKGDPYFVSCRQGAEEAARELDVELLWDGPTDLDPAKQNEVVEGWITRGVDVIAVSVENQAGISTVLRKARAKGIKVITWDADAQRDARDFLINQATPEGIGMTLADEAARILNGKGEFAIITASLSAANQNEWIKHIRARLTEKHSGVRLATIRPSDGDRDRAFVETQTVLKVYPAVRVVMGIATPAVPGAAEAVKQSGRTDVRVIGLSLPNMCKPYVHAGVVESIVLWNTIDLGYLTVQAARAVVTGQLKPGERTLAAGRLGSVAVRDDEVLLGTPFIFHKGNIDRFHF